MEKGRKREREERERERERERREREERVKLSLSILCGKERINPRACSFDEITEAAESTAKKKNQKYKGK